MDASNKPAGEKKPALKGQKDRAAQAGKKAKPGAGGKKNKPPRQGPPSEPNLGSYVAKRLLHPETTPSEVAEGQAVLPRGQRKVCILHIGMHKTGSTSIQNTLAAIGARDNWRYVHAGWRNSSLPIQAAFRINPERSWLIQHEGFSEAHANEIREKMREQFAKVLQQPAEKYILSAEAFTTLDAVEVREMVEWLRQFVDEVHAVGYVRPAQSYMESAFQQHLKTRANRKFQFERTYPRYRERLEKYDEVLGKDKVQLTLFAKEALYQGDVVRDFAHKAGIKLDPAEILRSNESLSRDAMSLLYIHERSMPAELSPRQRLTRQTKLGRLIGDMPGSRLQFAARLVEPVIAHHREDIEWAERRIGAKLGAIRDDTGLDVVSEQADMRIVSVPARQWLDAQLTQLGEPLLGDTSDVKAIAKALQLVVSKGKQLMSDAGDDQASDD